MTYRRLAALGLLAALLTGCSKAPQPADNPVVTPSQTSASVPASTPAPESAPASASTSAPPVTTSASSSTAPVSSTPPSSSSAAPTSSAPPTSVAPVGPAGCATSALAVSVMRGSGVAGHQFAFLQFTNSSAKTCSLTGFPGVQLLLSGKALGKPAARSAKAARTITLKPHASATAQLTDASTCNANNADQIQIIPPNETHRVLLPLSLRGCALTIDPVAVG